ncbi:MAG: HIT domain-containing protein, partial [Candidatus Micrarchaeia archaeon]
MPNGEAVKYNDIFDNEEVIGKSTIIKVGTMRIVASMDADQEYHFLVMTIAHRNNSLELTDAERSDYALAERVIAEFYKMHGIGGYSKIELVGEEAGRTIPHWHVHFVPGKSDNFHNNPKDRPIHRSGVELSKFAEGLRPQFEEIAKSLCIA